MRKEARLLLERSMDSLILSIEHFNRPLDIGRSETVLILLDHSFELLLKSAILMHGRKIRKKRERQTIGFDECVRVAIEQKIINSEQALTLQTINSLRDAAQHYILEISEQFLYLQAQAGVTLYRDILKRVFEKDMARVLPQRVLPLSIIPPADITALFETEVEEIRKLLSPHKRRMMEATAKLRALAIFDASIRGEKYQPGQSDLNGLAAKIRQEKKWQDVFPGVAAVEISSEGSGYQLSLRISKKEGMPVQLVPEGTPGATVVAIRRVNELDYYNLSLTQVADNVKLSSPRTLAIIRYLKLQADPEYFRYIVLGKVRFGRYSQKTIAKIREELPKVDIEQVWHQHGSMRKKRA